MKQSIGQRISNALRNPAWICFAWFGMTAGVSMLATPARFSAPTVTREIALDIGRVVFAVLNKAELIALILLLLVVRLSNRTRQWWAISAALAFIVIVQTVWLLPELAERTQQIVAGGEPPPSFVHATYSTLELIKLGLLFSLGIAAMTTDHAAKNGPGRSDVM
jgi:hypothetical protein